ncbi:MAG TPA: hypothetical protein VIK91_16200 [Nannocystis sp.]
MTSQTAPSPLPADIRDDPAIAGALDAQRRYEDRVAAVRADPGLDELARAEAVAESYSELTQALTAYAEDLRTRRTARLEYLRSQLPIGPGVPEDASPADRAVIMSAFRHALERARSVTGEEAKAMLADAVRFDDVVVTRAVLTAAAERGEGQIFDQWAAATGSEELLSELRAIERALNGTHPDAPWEAKAFRLPARPREIGNLPLLRKQAEQRAREAERAARYAVPVYRRY